MSGEERLKPATCKCGHKGKSKNPEFYLCSFCYYTARAKSNLEMVSKLRARIPKLIERIPKLIEEAERFEEQARDFRRRHPR